MSSQSPPPLPDEIHRSAVRKQFIVIMALLGMAIAVFWGLYGLLYWNAHRPLTEQEQVAIQKSIDARAASAKPDDWGKGWELGYKMGYVYAQAGEPVPTGEALNSAAHEVSSHSNSIMDKEQFDRGYYGGFAAGYKAASKPAF